MVDTPSDDLVEKVARLLCLQAQHDPDEPFTCSCCGELHPMWKNWIANAHEMLAALRLSGYHAVRVQ